MEASSGGMLIGVLLFFYALYWALYGRLFSSQRRNKKLQPPIAGGAWPVIGHLHLLTGYEPTYKILGKMADVYGPIFRLKMGRHRAVVVSNWEIAKECFTTKDRVFASRPKLVAATHMGYNNTMFAFTQYGSLWRHLRKITTHEILSNHRLDLFQHVRRSEVQSSVKKLYELWVKGGGETVLVEMNKWFGDLTLNIIFRVVVGKRFTTTFEGSGGEGEQFREALKDFFELFGAFVPSDSFPFVSWLDLGGYEKAMKKTAKVLDKTLHKWLIEHQRKRDYNNCDVVLEKEEDFMDMMLSNVQDVQELSGYDVGTITKSTCLKNTTKALTHIQESKMEAFSKIGGGILIGLLLFLYGLFRVLSGRKKHVPPEAGSAWPVIGHLHLLTGSEPAHKTLGEMADAYGPIFTLKIGSHRAVVVSNWEIAKHCFTTNDRAFASRPKLVAATHMGYNNTMFAFTQYGPLWRHIRKITTHEILSNHRLDLFQHIRRSEVESSIKKLHQLWVKSQGEKVLVEMKNWFQDLTLNTIFRTLVGKRFTTTFEESSDGSGGGEGEQFREALKNSLQLFGAFVPSDSFPFLSWLDLGGYEKAMKKTAKVLDKTLQKWLIEHQQRRNYNHSGEVVQKEEDFMDVMLSTVQDVQELIGYDVDTITKSTCLTLILGGAESTQVTMTWALSLLLNHQDTLRKAQLELDEQVGRERLVAESDVKKLLYLQAIVKETMRLYPAAPLAGLHEAMEDCTVVGYHIPIRTRLIVNLKKLQRDPLVWEDPNEFRPERFLTTHKDFDVKGQNPQLIPFGSGRRMCPGVSFANQVMHLTLANLLHGFEIGRPSQELINMEESIGLTSAKITPLEVVLTPRLHAQVYV